MKSRSSLLQPTPAQATPIREQIDAEVDALIVSLPKPEDLSAGERRGIIARYAAVLEGNFIYWMTGAYLAVRTPEARAIVLENLHEEVRDCHPGMLRRFVVAANAAPTDTDALAVSRELMNVRLFVGRLSGVRMAVMMAFFEAFIQQFMAFLADLAARQGSEEQEYTAVHGVCDIAHSEELFHALEMEMAFDPETAESHPMEGVELLRTLIERILRIDSN